MFVIDPPPLPVTLPPVGGHPSKQSKTSTTTTTYSNNSSTNAVHPNIQKPQATVRQTTWHTHYTNNGAPINAQMMSNNNFLDNERAASAVAAG